MATTIKMNEKAKHFVLIHGACHGAWCWYKLATQLKSNGHTVTVLDMAASGVHPKRYQELSSFSDYAEPLMEFMESLPSNNDRIVLVGHSLGGVTISLAMEKFPTKIAVAVFVTALMPGPHLTLPTITQEHYPRLDSVMDTRHEYSKGDDKPPTSLLFGPNFLSTKLYQLSPPEDLTLATLLVRPLAIIEDEVLLKEIELSNENYGTVSRVYVICDKDYVFKEDFQRWMIEKNPANEVRVIPDSDHMVMFSKSRELCSCLEEISENYC